MKENFLLNDLEQIKALSDPLRLRIIKAFSEPMTTKQVADLLGEPPTKLYRHVQILEKLKLIKLVRKRTNRGIVEKYYEAVAKDFEIDRALFASIPKEESLKAFYEMVNGILQSTLNDISQSIKMKQEQPDKQINVTLIREEIKTSPKKIEALKKRLNTWIKDFESANEVDGEVDYSLTLFLYPSKPLDESSLKEE